MKTLMIMRHAKSSWSNSALSDHSRPLNERGKHDSPRMGRLLAAEDLVPGRIISSTAVRAADTAGLVALAAGFEGDIMYTDDLYHAEPEAYIALANGVDDEINSILMVGHNPGIEELVQDLSGQAEHMPTAALAVFEVAISSWSDLNLDQSVNLTHLWLPKALP